MWEEYLLVVPLLIDNWKNIMMIKLINFFKFLWILQYLSFIKATASYHGTRNERAL